jgi:hypothetical protein
MLPLTVGDELIAGADEAGDQPLVRTVCDSESVVEEARIGVVAGGQSLHLAKEAHTTGRDTSAVHVMIDTLGSRQYIADSHLRVNTAGQTRADDGIGVVFLHEVHGSHCGIHLADTTLPEDYFVISQTTPVATKGIVHLTILDVHCYDNTYLHIVLLY